MGMEGGGGRGFKVRGELNHRADILDFFLSFFSVSGKRQSRET